MRYDMRTRTNVNSIAPVRPITEQAKSKSWLVDKLGHDGLLDESSCVPGRKYGDGHGLEKVGMKAHGDGDRLRGPRGVSFETTVRRTSRRVRILEV